MKNLQYLLELLIILPLPPPPPTQPPAPCDLSISWTFGEEASILTNVVRVDDDIVFAAAKEPEAVEAANDDNDEEADEAAAMEPIVWWWWWLLVLEVVTSDTWQGSRFICTNVYEDDDVLEAEWELSETGFEVTKWGEADRKAVEVSKGKCDDVTGTR